LPKKSRNRLRVQNFFYTFAPKSINNEMKATEQTLNQVERIIRKIAEKFPAINEAVTMTDIHIRVIQDTGEVVAFDDDDQEITRCVIEQWIGNTDEDFYQQIEPILRKSLTSKKKIIENIALLKPYSFVLEDDDKETVAELYLVDDETVIIDPDLMEGLDKDLDDFLDKLLKS